MATHIFAQTPNRFGLERIGEKDSLNSLKQSLQLEFLSASATYAVPVQIIQAIAYVETHWVQRIPEKSSVKSDKPKVYGVMGLRDDEHLGHSLIEAAKIIQQPIDSIIYSSAINIRAGAALLRRYMDDIVITNGIDDRKIEAWGDVVKRYSGIPDGDIAEICAADIYRLINHGFDENGVKIDRLAVDSLKFIKNIQKQHEKSELSQPDYSPAHWVAAYSGNYQTTNRPTDYAVNEIVIHTTEGSYASAISTFQSSTSGVSAHYIIRSSDGDITQMVEQKNTAYHAGNLSHNHRSVGIELEGFADDASYFTTAMYSKLKDLIKYIAGVYSIPTDRVHIIGHNQIPSETDATKWGGTNGHYDPGGYFDWSKIISLINGTSTTFQTVKVVNTSTLNVRTGPGASEPLLTTVSQDQRFVAYTNYNGWYLVFVPGQASQHYDGWVSGSYLSIINNAPQVQVKNSGSSCLRVRNGVLASSTVLDKVCDGQRFALTGQKQAGFDGYTWYEYYLPQSSGSTTGWSSGAYFDIVNSVKGNNNSNVSGYELEQNYPNPFNPMTKIKFEVPESGLVTLSVFDLLGNEVAVLFNKIVQSGNYEVEFNGSHFASGVYFYRLQAGANILSKKLMLLK
jgi:N-acetyl-anhydromuramyl-L-alanine amidase AmpD